MSATLLLLPISAALPFPPLTRTAAPSVRLSKARKPALFVIGAMKSGTTYLSKLLDAHPSIFMCRPEEPSYFVKPRELRKLWPDMWDQGYWRSEDNYLRLFDEAREATILGEASTNYTKFPLVTDVPERICSFNRDARFIYILRDPVERTISHYWHRVRYHAERRPPLDAIKADPRFICVSHYARQLEIFYSCFGRDRFKVLTYEQLTSAPDETMQSLYEWLGVNPLAADKTKFAEPENVTPKVVKMAAGAGVLRRLRQLWPMRALVPHIPGPLRKAVVQIADKSVDRMSVDMSEVIAYLRPIQRRQTDELARQLGCDFPEWTTLYSDSPK